MDGVGGLCNEEETMKGSPLRREGHREGGGMGVQKVIDCRLILLPLFSLVRLLCWGSWSVVSGC